MELFFIYLLVTIFILFVVRSLSDGELTWRGYLGWFLFWPFIIIGLVLLIIFDP